MSSASSISPVFRRRNRSAGHCPKSVSLCVEALETRRLLAGDVSVTLSGGDLILRGDLDDNQVEISVNDAGDIAVSGINQTLINGSADPFVASGSDGAIGDDLRIDLRGGNDSISVSGLRADDDARIFTGEGDDTVALQGLTVPNALTVWTGSGSDTVIMTGSPDTRLGKLYLDAGSGDNGVGLSKLVIDGDVTVRASRGSDSVALADVTIGDDLRIVTSSGNDTIGIVDSQVGDDTSLDVGAWLDSGVGSLLGLGGSVLGRLLGRGAPSEPTVGELENATDRTRLNFGSRLGLGGSILGGLLGRGTSTEPTDVDSTSTDRSLNVGSPLGLGSTVLGGLLGRGTSTEPTDVDSTSTDRSLNVGSLLGLGSTVLGGLLGRGTSTEPTDNDSVVILNSVHRDRVIVSTRSGDDMLGLSASEIGGRARSSMGSGNDQVGVLDGVFGGATALDGGRDTDSYEASADTDFFSDPRVRFFEQDGMDDFQQQIDRVLAGLSREGLLDSDVPLSKPTIAEILAGDNFEVLRAALDATGLTETVDGEGTFTVFAPTDEAFSIIPPGVFGLLNQFAPALLRPLLLNHVVDTALTAEELAAEQTVQTLRGTGITIDVSDSGIVVNGRVNVLMTDMQASNGVVHVIDGVLL